MVVPFESTHPMGMTISVKVCTALMEAKWLCLLNQLTLGMTISFALKVYTALMEAKWLCLSNQLTLWE
jgi:hypothetical protein